MLSIIRMLSAFVLSLGLVATVAAAPAVVAPRLDAQSAGHSNAIVAHSQQPGTAGCEDASRTDDEQRADRLATLMMRHSIVSRLALGQDAAGHVTGEERFALSARHGEPLRSCG